MRNLIGALSVLGLCAMPLAVHAQTIVDGSGGDIPEALLAEMLQDLPTRMREPDAVQFRALAHSPDDLNQQWDWHLTICGFVNTKNAFGGYTGFMPFAWSGGLTKGINIFAGDAMPHAQEVRFQMMLSSCDLGHHEAFDDPARKRYREAMVHHDRRCGDAAHTLRAWAERDHQGEPSARDQYHRTIGRCISRGVLEFEEVADLLD